jgi:uncharacterized integral membrane protein (TIGR00698 family)
MTALNGSTIRPASWRDINFSLHRWWAGLQRLLPGLLLCIGVTGVAAVFAQIEAALCGRAWLEPLVLAILVGTCIRSCWTPGARWTAGIAFSGKTLLEVAVVLLGASISVRAVMAAGAGLLAGIAAVVVIAILASYGIGRVLGLPHRMATLIACGNAICGNSAIAAIAPVIGADGEDIAASIAFTAVLGVIVVLTLPLTVPLLHLTGLQYGALAGLTVYAVPQVLAATAPVGPLAVQLGTLVKLVRVLMLGPVVLVLSLLTRRRRDAPGGAGRPPLHRLAPWFIAGFLLLAGVRAVGGIPAAALPPLGMAANGLTVIAMAALGLGTDMRVVAKAGGRVTAAVTLSLAVLGALSLGLIRWLGLA